MTSAAGYKSPDKFQGCDIHEHEVGGPKTLAFCGRTPWPHHPSDGGKLGVGKEVGSATRDGRGHVATVPRPAFPESERLTCCSPLPLPLPPQPPDSFFFWVNCDNMGVRVASLNEEALPRPIFSPHFNEENERDYAEEGGPP